MRFTFSPEPSYFSARKVNFWNFLVLFPTLKSLSTFIFLPLLSHLGSPWCYKIKGKSGLFIKCSYAIFSKIFTGYFKSLGHFSGFFATTLYGRSTVWLASTEVTARMVQCGALQTGGCHRPEVTSDHILKYIGALQRLPWGSLHCPRALYYFQVIKKLPSVQAEAQSWGLHCYHSPSSANT